MDKRIRAIRAYLGLSQSEFSVRLGVSLTTVHNWETGRCDPSESAIIGICGMFGVSPKYLKDGVGEIFIKKIEKPTPKRKPQAASANSPVVCDAQQVFFSVSGSFATDGTSN